jgi:CII-binding regulator of phage lambda lysogenization HflD
MGCEIGNGLREGLDRLELEVSVAAQNYQYTGLSRYKQTLMASKKELDSVRVNFERHCQRCSICSHQLQALPQS